MLEKDNHCPMCRSEVNLCFEENNKYGILDRKWSIIDTKEVKCKESILELDRIFVSTFSKLLDS